MAEQHKEIGRQDLPRWDTTRSEVSGIAGDVLQARDVSGGVHFHRVGGAQEPVPRQLPAAVRDFTGRAADLLALDALLPADNGDPAEIPGQPGTVVITAIDGAAGIGKTTLAVHWAHRMRHRFPDGTLYTDLRGYGPGRPATPDEVLDGFLRALGSPPDRIPGGVDERAALYRSLLDDRRVLVVLDNANTPQQVRPLLPASATCLALITSRSSMTGLVISQGAARISLDLLPFDEATVLVRAIIGDTRANAEPEALTDIVRACARLPLALRIAGQRAAARPHLRLVDIVAELTDRRGKLDTLSASGDEPTAVRAVLDWSYRALPPQQAQLFRRLGLHPGVEISVHAAAALSDTAPEHVRPLLEALADVHLVEATARDRYRAHDLLRDYALELAERQESAEESEAAIQRLLGFYLHSADNADRRLATRQRVLLDATPVPLHTLAFDSDQKARDWFEMEYSNLIDAARYAAHVGLHAFGWQIPATIYPLLDGSGHRKDQVAVLQDGLASAQTLGDRRGEHYMHSILCVALTRSRRFDEAITHGRQAVEIAQQDGDRAGEASALTTLSPALCSTGQMELALRCCEQAAEIDLQLGDTWARMITLNFLGTVYQGLQRFDEALECHQQALAFFRQTRERTREGWTFKLLGSLHRATGDLGRAIECDRQAVAIARETVEPRHLAETLDSLGTDLDLIGEQRAAREHWHEALELFERLGHPQADDLRERLAG